MSITRRISSISPSLTLAITAKAKAMKAEGKSIIGFGAGEPDFNTPQHIIDAAKAALDKGFTKYTPSSGLLELRKKIAQKFKEDNNLDYEPSQIIVSSGAKHSIFNAMFALLEEGDEVIIPAPYWLTYPELVKVCGGVSVFVEGRKDNHFKVSPEDIKKAITPKTKLLVFNSPSNPTGAVYTEEEIRAIGKVVEEAGIYVLSDEIYSKLIYDGVKHFSIAAASEKLKERTVVVNGVSKTYAMTGWRIGWLAAPKDVAKAIDSFQSHATSNPSSISQYATIAALEGSEDELNAMRDVFNDRRKFMIGRIREIEGLDLIVPDGAFYIMLVVKNLFGKRFGGRKINGSLDVADMLLEKGVAVVPGIAFGDDECVRLSYAISKEDIAEGLNRIESFVKEVF
ncbi:pyridoxal phosphate-dependent aminotransferase [Candidatus Borkfalkia ceftriaxoniphila]|uniref:Aminotransferase n=1 Tax=Candidatus Borkfalkia ceftriaxoniphila TaxID=2508949 RepID=A0A4Q2KFS2_9FIRM|nr:pyridoxal phosphate-dependent aminotransferase [Candidatus Borkfalkia ceftriaxoniphila]RXZ62083.1 pyridoxal phosphate-dependent aminotransferase [Candidatus Borkfalkia ceftriaxoniphila]